MHVSGMPREITGVESPCLGGLACFSLSLAFSLAIGLDGGESQTTKGSQAKTGNAC